ncbi:gephyrin-like molybdotransferase Glp [Microvirga brassicacearum]|uniref:Molybdopterin molybdenumtransferase n=1 Tax=Microvirga brassicacearum TaxID=2580413 RepID=A0A5N3P4B6_9HYPH|nr:gephyrin-like molybdotransferase Glp [Microvirga brassicacearum]KAB0264577.1 molybdopterin molybdotransferase MoeA [Microvirga brassicacearum]
MSLISVEDALRNVLESLGGPAEPERVALTAARGRVLAEDVAAARDQPPFPASAMDGYAVRGADVAHVPATLAVIGASLAGRRFAGAIGPGEAVRIFTGAPLPEGADSIVIQEDTQSLDGGVLIRELPVPGRHIRPAGLDFEAGEVLLTAGRIIDARDLALAAAVGRGTLLARRKPRIAILATGDELVLPGDEPGPDQITAASLPALIAIVEKAGAEALDLGIARDTLKSLNDRIEAAEASGADMLVTLGGASVGEHDLVQQAMSQQGMTLGFWRVALRPGKPLMHGKLGAMSLIGLPGNPVSSIVCAILFVVPAIHALQGRSEPGRDPTEAAILGTDVSANGDRQDYMRASLATGPDDGRGPTVMPHAMQDSSMLGVLARSDALLVRAPRAPSARAGDPCRIIRLERFC